MRFLQKLSGNNYQLRVNVKLNSKKQEMVYNGKFLTISLRSKAIQNKANKELINLIKNKLELSLDQIRITSGVKNSNKLIKLTLDESVDEKDIYDKLFN
jgi:uncharacterized protein YggU (UPF0235/DUF167 family)